MTNTGHDARTTAIVENLKRRAQTINNTEVIERIDQDELREIRRDLANAVATIATEFQGELDQMKRDFGTVLDRLNQAAEAELRRRK